MTDIFPLLSLSAELRNMIYECAADWSDYHIEQQRIQKSIDARVLQFDARTASSALLSRGHSKRDAIDVGDFVLPPLIRPEQPRLRTPTVLLINQQIASEARDVRKKLPQNILSWMGPGDLDRLHYQTYLSQYISTAALQSICIVAIDHLGKNSHLKGWIFDFKMISILASIWKKKHALKHIIVHLPRGSCAFSRQCFPYYDNVSNPVYTAIITVLNLLRRLWSFAGSHNLP
ncbi:hypothetical protein LTS18_013889 [Coniosporium uncinatum]|uniref:Uncharacterized protein n=1 Tax=Coniosporium uncinatum TaxID=93489 RepID=A0ACC3D8P9_9PEZI|nr:hypothetical protein LTS18_013889 [Coniosporium uncinatum]